MTCVPGAIVRTELTYIMRIASTGPYQLEKARIRRRRRGIILHNTLDQIGTSLQALRLYSVAAHERAQPIH